MEKQKYQVFQILVFHYGDGTVRETEKPLGYTWAVSEISAIRNLRYRNRRNRIHETLYGPAISERYRADIVRN